MRISDWSSDVCSSDLGTFLRIAGSFPTDVAFAPRMGPWRDRSILAPARRPWRRDSVIVFGNLAVGRSAREHAPDLGDELRVDLAADRSEEHTSELQSLMRISYAVFCLKKKKRKQKSERRNQHTHISLMY